MANERIFVRVPDFQYSGDYYPQIRSRLRQWSRANVPEITNEDAREPFIQAESAFSLMAHYNNVLLDMVANSLFLTTATVPESVKMLLELINGRLLPAGPGRVDMLGKLRTTYSTTTRLLEPYRKFATKRIPDVPELIFENTSAVDTTMRTDEIGYAYGMDYDRAGASQATVSSVDSDIVEDLTAPFTTADLNHYMTITGSSLGNDVEELRIIELLDEDTPGNYTKVRLKGASFISESSLTWSIYNISTSVASDWNAGTGANPFSGALFNKDKLYIGHPDIMFDRLDFTLTGVTPSYTGVWEFYDPTTSSTNPDDVTVGVGDITFDLTTLLGAADVNGALVEVEYIPSGAKFKKFSVWQGGVNAVVTSELGQSSPSDDPNDYTVTAKWRPLDISTDNTIVGASSMAQSGKIEYTLPQTRTDSWYKFRLYDHTDSEEKTAFFVRYRIVSHGGSSFHTVDRVQHTEGDHYIIIRLVQGKTVEDTPFSSNGESGQQFVLSKIPYVLNSARVFVDEGGGEFEWTVFTTLLRSLSTDRHCVVEPQTDGTAILRFGNGTNGKIPNIGTNNIRVVYRIGADRNGNIGANTLTVNRDGIGVFRTITNPRQGKFWIEADWASPEALERAKVRGPKLLRTMYRAVSASDVEILSQAFINQNGVRPVARSQAYEESLGPKTVELVVTGGGGAALDANEIEELQEYYNGGSTYGYGGILVVNHELTVTNYQPKLIAVNIQVEAFDIITETMVRQVLASLLNPTAVERDGRSYVWRFGQTVSLSKIESEVFNLSPGNIFDVDVTSPSEDIALTARELPVFDTSSNVVIVSPRFISS